MNIILLPGNTSANKEWINKFADILKSDFESTLVQYYDHWEKGGELIDVDREVEKLSDLTKNLDNYAIFAKSAGTLVVLKAIKKAKINPQKCIFIGFPVYWAKDKDIDFREWIINFSVPTLFIQHTEDPVIFADDLKKFLDKNNFINYKFSELAGNSHNYLEFEIINKLISEFVYKN